MSTCRIKWARDQAIIKYTRGWSVLKYFITERHSYRKYPFFQEQDADRRIHIRMSCGDSVGCWRVDAGCVCVCVCESARYWGCHWSNEFAPICPRSAKCEYSWRTFSCNRPLGTKKLAMCVHTENTTVNAENKIHRIALRRFTAELLFDPRPVNISRTMIFEGAYMHSERRPRHWRLPGAVAALRDDTESLPRGRSSWLKRASCCSTAYANARWNNKRDRCGCAKNLNYSTFNSS